jgi:hypothetical protein
MPADDLLVVERVADALEPGWLVLPEDGEADHDGEHEDGDRDGSSHDVSLRVTSATKASSSSSEPSLTYA